MDKNRFIVIGDDGISYIATVITNMNAFGNVYCIYTIPQKNKDSNLYIARFNDNNFEPIKDEKENEMLTGIMKKLILGSNE